MPSPANSISTSVHMAYFNPCRHHPWMHTFLKSLSRGFVTEGCLQMRVTLLFCLLVNSFSKGVFLKQNNHTRNAKPEVGTLPQIFLPISPTPHTAPHAPDCPVGPLLCRWWPAPKSREPSHPRLGEPGPGCRGHTGRVAHGGQARDWVHQGVPARTPPISSKKRSSPLLSWFSSPAPSSATNMVFLRGGLFW